MPETMYVSKCESRKNCPWNETQWFTDIDPGAESRERMYHDEMVAYNIQLAEMSATASASSTSGTATGARAEVTSAQEGARAPPKGFDPHAVPPPPAVIKHKVSKPAKDIPAPQALKKRTPPPLNLEQYRPDQEPTPTTDDESTFMPPTVVEEPPAMWSPEKPLTLEEFAKTRIEEDRLSPGVKDMGDTRYILRPEALESVFYMHRITGDPYWRKAGWKMVSSILKATRTQYGHAAILDVTSDTLTFEDKMESFWLAETLKYAYLLFEDESKWSLDDWVLNTEAHFFKRPPPVK